MVEAVDRVTQTLRTQILIDRRRLAFDRAFDRRIMEHCDASLGAQRPQLVLELARLVQRFLDERLGDRLSERRQLAAAITAHEAFDPGEADTLDLDGLL